MVPKRSKIANNKNDIQSEFFNMDDSFTKSLKNTSWVIHPIENESLASYTSVKVGGKASFIISVSNLDELRTPPEYYSLPERAEEN